MIGSLHFDATVAKPNPRSVAPRADCEDGAVKGIEPLFRPHRYPLEARAGFHLVPELGGEGRNRTDE
jgi:hypothetical protein